MNFSGRILRQRKGHTAPPSRIRYLYPGYSAGGLDRSLRIFWTRNKVKARAYRKKAKETGNGQHDTWELLLPPDTAMASCEARSRDWGDLVTIYQDHAMAYVWSNKKGAQWGPVLRQPTWNVSPMKLPPPPKTHASSVAMSACGNFALVGTKGGIIYKYNVQSGNTRGSYPADAGTEEEQQDGYQRKILHAGDCETYHEGSGKENED